MDADPEIDPRPRLLDDPGPRPRRQDSQARGQGRSPTRSTPRWAGPHDDAPHIQPPHGDGAAAGQNSVYVRRRCRRGGGGLLRVPSRAVARRHELPAYQQAGLLITERLPADGDVMNRISSDESEALKGRQAAVYSSEVRRFFSVCGDLGAAPVGAGRRAGRSPRRSRATAASPPARSATARQRRSNFAHTSLVSSLDLSSTSTCWTSSTVDGAVDLQGIARGGAGRLPARGHRFGSMRSGRRRRTTWPYMSVAKSADQPGAGRSRSDADR